MEQRKRVSGDPAEDTRNTVKELQIEEERSFRQALTPDSLQYEQTAPLPFTLVLSAASGGRCAPSSPCVWNSLCVCLTKPISQTGVEYQNGRRVPTSSNFKTSSSVSVIMKLLLLLIIMLQQKDMPQFSHWLLLDALF